MSGNCPQGQFGRMKDDQLGTAGGMPPGAVALESLKKNLKEVECAKLRVNFWPRETLALIRLLC